MTHIYAKTMKYEFYHEGTVIDTSTYNYSNAVGIATDLDEHLYNVILQISSISEVAFGVLTLFAMETQGRRLQRDLLDQLEAGDENLKVDLGAHVLIEKGARIVDGAPLSHLVLAALKCDIQIGSPRQSAAFWEYFYEFVRIRHRPDAPKRLESFFACSDADSLKRYRKRHGLGEVECMVDAAQCHTIFQADMTILDEIDGNMNFSQAFSEVIRYWNQEYSHDPITEVLLQGNVTILERID